MEIPVDSAAGKLPFRVLHVDDAPAERYRRRRALERGGFVVIEADSGAAALERIATDEIDLALLDVRLPDTSGFDLGRRIKQHAAAQRRDIAVILISTYFTDSDTRVQGLESGADAYLIEPVPDQELVATLRAVGRLLRQLRQARGMEAVLVRQAEELREADRAKNEFLAGVVHELRQPIQAIVSAVSVMRLRPNRRTGERARETIDRQAQQLASITEELLDAAKVVRGEVSMKLQVEDLRDVVRRALETVRPAVTAREHQLDAAFPDQPVPVRADASRLQQVFVNILTNAVRYTPPGGQIALAFEVQPSEAAVRIADSGVGIAEADLSRIFDLFTRASSEGSGFGIGLAVARSIVEKHGGRIEACSAGPSRGSQFVVTMPSVVQ
jgi:signal transduction histidine kinase